MSKRAEDYANKRFPPDMGEDYVFIRGGFEIKECDFNSDRRFGCKIGYEQAEKDLGWHSVDECLPPIDEEVIALTNRMHGKELPYVGCICFAHRPNPEGWDGKDFETGEVKHYDVVTYDGWNIPGVKYWMHNPELPEGNSK